MNECRVVVVRITGNDFNPLSNAPIPTFPRTVPRTVSLQRTSDRGAPPTSSDSQNRMSQFVDLVLPPPPPIPSGLVGVNGDVRTANSHDVATDERQ